MATTHIIDVADRIVARLPGNLRGANLTELATIIGESVQELEDVFWDLFTKRFHDTAQSAVLDVIGRIVKQPRPSADDAVYARYIAARIAARRSRGTVNELIGIVRLMIEGVTSIIVRREDTATVVVQSLDAVDTALADDLIKFLQDAVAAGVRILLITNTVPAASAFTLAVGAGLGFGTAAQLDLANTGLGFVTTLLRCRRPGAVGNSFSMSFVESGSAPNNGSLTSVGNAWTFTFKDATTTVANFETAINLTDELHVLSSGGAHTLVDGDDNFAATLFAGGIDGGVLAGERE